MKYGFGDGRRQAALAQNKEQKSKSKKREGWTSNTENLGCVFLDMERGEESKQWAVPLQPFLQPSTFTLIDVLGQLKSGLGPYLSK